MQSLTIFKEKDIVVLEKKVRFLFWQYRNEKLSFDEYNFWALEIILSQYFGYMPRVNIIC